MPVTKNNSADGQELTIAIQGRFDFGVQKDFRHSYEDSAAKRIVVDMRNTDYMDSSALGMLLMMREYAGGSSAEISLKNCSSDIKTILNVANFNSLFDIS